MLTRINGHSPGWWAAHDRRRRKASGNRAAMMHERHQAACAKARQHPSPRRRSENGPAQWRLTKFLEGCAIYRAKKRAKR